MQRLEDIPDNSIRVFYLDPATKFKTRSEKGMGRSAENHYRTLTWPELFAFAAQIDRIAAKDAVMIAFTTWPQLVKTLDFIAACDFTYKTCAFDWMKADVSTVDLFPDPKTADMKMGYWTRSNSEPALLATRGRPKRQKADVRMGIIEPAREHSRKPDCIYGRIERLVAGPYLELFSRTSRHGWICVGDEVGKFRAVTK